MDIEPMVPGHVERVEATPGTMYGHMLFSVTREQIQQMIDRSLIEYVDRKIAQAEIRLLKKLDKPWWKRW